MEENFDTHTRHTIHIPVTNHHPNPKSTQFIVEMKYAVSAVAFASLAAHAAAQGCNVQFDLNNLSGNPITAPVNAIVPAGTPFTIKWTVRDPSLPVFSCPR